MKNVEDVYTLSPMQQGMLFHSLYAPASGVYVEQMSCTLRGELDHAAFKAAWQGLIERHPVFRTAFLWEGLDEPVQVVRRRVELPWQEHDWRGADPAEQAARLRELLRADQSRDFTLTSAPLMRFVLIRMADDVCTFVWTHHHLLLDGWSRPIALGEVFQRYAAAAFERPLALPPARPYRDYIAWIQRQSPARAETFWRAYLRGVSAPTPLGVDQPADPAAAPTFAVQARRLGARAAAALDAAARAQALTLNTLVQGSWALLLARYSGQNDVLFGATVSGRPPDLPGSAGMIGLFINTLPVRISVPPQARIRDWLPQIQAQQAEQRQFEYSALVQIQGWSAIPRRLPLFESLLVFENYPTGEAVAASVGLPRDDDRAEPDGAQPARLAIADIRNAERTNYPLTLVVAPGEELLLEASYDTRRMAAPVIARLLGHLQTLLTSMAAAPGARLADLPLLTPAERQQILAEWNDTAAAVRGQGSGVRGQGSGVRGRQAAGSRQEPSGNQGDDLYALFADQAARSPDAIALAFEDARDAGRTARGQGAGGEDQQRVRGAAPWPLPPDPWNLSYAALAAQAERLARRLADLGVGPATLVAVSMERSVELIVALLGVLRAGAAYVPIDPRYPSERRAFMLEDSGATLLIATDDEGPTIKDEERETNEGATFVFRPSSFVNAASAQTGAGGSGERLAYVIYTSGSTGTPKGAMITQRGLANFSLALAEQIGLHPGRRFLQFASFSFDASALQVFPTLISGATLVLHRDPTRLSNQELLDLCVRQQVAILDLPASFWQQWVADLAARDAYLPDAVEVCMTGGERLTRERLRTWERLARRPVRFLSSYGPTEATITTTLFRTISDQVARLEGPDVPLGAALPNVTLYLLDAQMQPVPIGAAGELYIGGVQLARGYLARPDLTAERFVPNPFAPINMAGVETQYLASLPPYTRLYKTGDLARWRDDGAIVFLGRIDGQIKLRGFRVEPGEVEAALRAHPAVREAVALARTDAPGDLRIVAYVVPRSGVRGQGPESASEDDLIPDPRSLIPGLRDWLAARLPEHMLPAAIVALDALPLGPNGKLDRDALPAPDWAALAARRSAIVPRDAIELELAQIWESVLKVSPIGVADNFFDLGGHSLAAVGLLGRIQKRMKRDLPLAALLQGPTIEQMAALLRERSGGAPASPLVRIQPSGARPPLFLVHPAGGTVLCYFPLAQRLGRDQPCYGLQSPGVEAGQDPLRQVERMAAHYIEALRGVQPEGPYRLGGWSLGGVVAFEMARQLRAQGQTTALLALLDTGAPQPAPDAPAPDDARLMIDVLGRAQLPMPFDEFRLLDLDAQLGVVLACLQQANALPPGADIEQARRLLNVFKANVAALSAYAPQPYDGPITLFKTDAPLEAEQPGETPGSGSPDDPSMGWQRLAAQPVAIRPIGGTHETAIFEPHVRELAEQLRACLDALTPAQSPAP